MIKAKLIPLPHVIQRTNGKHSSQFCSGGRIGLIREFSGNHIDMSSCSRFRCPGCDQMEYLQRIEILECDIESQINIFSGSQAKVISDG